MSEHGIDRAMLAPEPKRDHKELRNQLKALTPLQDTEKRSATRMIPLPDSIHYSTMGITRFRPHHHSRSTYMVIFNPKPQQPEAGSNPSVSESKVLIIRPELHPHEHDHILRVHPEKIEEMYQQFEVDPHDPKFRPKKLTSKKPEDIQRHRALELAQHGQIIALLRLLGTALQHPPAETPLI